MGIPMVSGHNADPLLVSPQGPDSDTAWSAFFSCHQSMLHGLARRLGLSEEDAQDAVQETMIAFVQTCRLGEYDPDKGAPGAWLLGIARHKIERVREHRSREIPMSQRTLADRRPKALPVKHLAGGRDNEEMQRTILKACINQVRREVQSVSMRAFELFAVKGWSVTQVAAHLGVSPNAVYLAKSRILSRLRELCRSRTAATYPRRSEVNRHGSDRGGMGCQNKQSGEFVA